MSGPGPYYLGPGPDLGPQGPGPTPGQSMSSTFITLSLHSVTNTSPSTLLCLGSILVVSFVLDTEHTLLRLGDLVKKDCGKD